MFFRAITCGLLIGVAFGAAGLPSFDIASVRPGSHAVSRVDRIDATRLRAVSAPMSELIEYAWRVPQDRISGPDGIRSPDHTFDIDATMPAPTSDEQSRLMLRHLLTDRFSLTLHTVHTLRNGYALTVDKGGPLLKTSALTTAAGIRVAGDAADAQVSAPAAYLSQFAGILSLILDTPVENRTQLVGLYEIQTVFSKPGPNETDAPTVFDAVKRLGLRLERAKVPVDSIVVDHVNLNPTAN